MDDIEMLNFIDNGIYGGYSASCESYARSNVPGKKGFNPNKPYCTLAMVDCTNQV